MYKYTYYIHYKIKLLTNKNATRSTKIYLRKVMLKRFLAKITFSTMEKPRRSVKKIVFRVLRITNTLKLCLVR